jgi:hypothetical protein
MHRVHRARSRRRVALATLPLLIVVGVLAITLSPSPAPQSPQRPIADGTPTPAPIPTPTPRGAQPQSPLRTVFIASDPTILDRLRAPSTPTLTIRADTSTTLASIDDDQLLEILRESGVAAGLAYTEDGVKLAFATLDNESIINTPSDPADPTPPAETSAPNPGDGLAE